MMMAMFGSVLLAFICAWALMRPHFCLATDASGLGVTQQELFDRKERTVQLIKDLDLDFSTGKLVGSDYDRMRSTLTAELAKILTQIDGTKPAK